MCDRLYEEILVEFHIIVFLKQIRNNILLNNIYWYINYMVYDCYFNCLLTFPT